MNCHGMQLISKRPSKHILILSLLFITGCQSIGPNRIKEDATPYKKIVGEIRNTDLLTDIVRLRYVEPLYALKISSVTASYALSSSLALSAGWNWDRTLGNGTSLVSPTIAYTDSPTISYTPVEGKVFIDSLLQPITADAVNLLSRGGGHNPKLIYRLIFAEIGDMDNASFATGSGAYNVPRAYVDESLKYVRFINTLDAMIKQRVVSTLQVTLGDSTGIMLHFNKHVTPAQAKAVAYMKKSLNVSQSQKDVVLLTYGVNTPIVNHDGVLALNKKEIQNVVLFQLRSSIGILQFLSNAVEIPEADLKAGIAKPQNYIGGRPIDWRPFMEGIMNIRTCDEQPNHAFLKTYYRGHWFYISDDDHASKVTFSLVLLLLQMSEASVQATSKAIPQLTLSVGAR